MKFTVTREEFLQNLTTADSIINVKTPLAMLLNVYIEALEDGSVLMLSYNGENGVKVEFTGVVEVPGKLSLSSKKLLDIVRHLTSEKIVFESKSDNDNEVMVHPEGLDNPLFDINGVPADSFPTFKEFNWENYIKIAQETLREQIQSTEFAVTTDFSKAAFTGAYIEEAVEGLLSFVTTDGKRLAVITRDYEDKVGTIETGVIVPHKIFKTIIGALSSGDVLFSVHNNQSFFKIGNVYIFTNLVEGKFPNYKDVIPSDKINVAVVESDLLLTAIETVASMSDPDSGKVKVEIGDNRMKLSTFHPIHGAARNEIDIDYKGSPITIAFSHKAIGDFLKVVSGRKIEMVINSQSSPILMRTLNDENYIYVTMPMKLNEA